MRWLRVVMGMVDRYLLVLNVIDWFLSCPFACQYVGFEICSPFKGLSTESGKCTYWAAKNAIIRVVIHPRQELREENESVFSSSKCFLVEEWSSCEVLLNPSPGPGY
jgi:hypothetical protein